jgi:hypothetical protein
MEKKQIYIVVCTLLIAATVLPVASTMNVDKTQIKETNIISGENKEIVSQTTYLYDDLDVDSKIKFKVADAWRGSSAVIGLDAGTGKNLMFWDYDGGKCIMKLDGKTGNVGIGLGADNHPDTKLHVKGDPSTLGTGTLKITSYEGGTQNMLLDGNEIDSDTKLYLNHNSKFNVVVTVLEIEGGGDIAEPFDIKGKDAVEPGMVVVIDSENPGNLKISDKAYDRCVAGIISGAGGIQPGLMITQKDTFEGAHHVALAGRVYGLCDASYGTIEPGDLLTTSSTSGYAMKVTNYEKAQGAILGKAMTSLDEGQGLVLILVTLQ